VRRQTVGADAVEEHLSARRLVDAGNHVEAGRLAGTVRTEQAQDLALVDIEAHIIDCLEAAEVDGEVFD
jgi:hypothetical protein